MTENKRFSIDKDGITIIDNCTDGLTECKYSTEAKLLCNFLNELSEENEELKKQVSRVEALQILKELEEENEQLKKEAYDNLDGLNFYQEENASLGERISDLECENEQLKQYKILFEQLQLQLRDVKRASDLDSKDFDDLLRLSKGEWFEETDEHIGWKRVDLK